MSYIAVFGRSIAGFSKTGFGPSSILVVTLRRSEDLLGNNGFADPGLTLRCSVVAFATVGLSFVKDGNSDQDGSSSEGLN